MEYSIMQIAESPLDIWLMQNAEIILQKTISSGFIFEVKQISSGKIAVKCTIPGKAVRYVEFQDHRINNPEGGAPHICNNWVKGGEAKPFGWDFAKQVSDPEISRDSQRSVAIMCLTQTAGYAVLKEGVFTPSEELELI